MNELDVQQWNVKDLKPYRDNPRVNEGAVESVAKSIEEFGFKVPMIIQEDGTIVAGHTRLKAVVMLGIDTVPVVIADDLTDKQIKAFRIADNRVAENAEWDMDKLQEELEGLDDVFTGFEDDMDELFADEDEDDEVEPDVKFTEELGEKNNYLVLFFDNEIDWLQAETLFDLETVKALDSKPGFEKKGVGRVVDGTKFINEMFGGGE